jgi:tRNA(Arg) A34 adenosine deaminase TadA
MKTIFNVLLKYNSIHPNDLRCQHIAGVFYKRTLISVGFNQRKSHPIQKRFGRNEYSIYLHAELDAIASALRIIDSSVLSDCTLAVIRVDKVGNIISSKPCNGCLRAIAAFNFRKVIHS